MRKSVSSRIHEAVKAIALCHNVTPVYESHAGVNGETESAEADQDFSDDNRTYQASSPDEVKRIKKLNSQLALTPPPQLMYIFIYIPAHFALSPSSSLSHTARIDQYLIFS